MALIKNFDDEVYQALNARMRSQECFHLYGAMTVLSEDMSLLRVPGHDIVVEIEDD